MKVYFIEIIIIILAIFAYAVFDENWNSINFKIKKIYKRNMINFKYVYQNKF